MQASWSPFQGVLGVYTGLRVAGDRVAALTFAEGTTCNDRRREAEILLLCAEGGQNATVVRVGVLDLGAKPGAG